MNHNARPTLWRVCSVLLLSLWLPLSALAQDDPGLPLPPTPGHTATQETWDPAQGIVLRGTILTEDKGVHRDQEHTVLTDGRVCIKGKMIQAVVPAGQPLPPEFANAKVIDTKGVILPGLIDCHNHIHYNTLRLWQGEDPPKTYINRYAWTKNTSYKQQVNYPKNLLTSSHYFDLESEAVKYAEIKALTGGVTAIQGASGTSNTGYNFLVRNLDWGMSEFDPHNPDDISNLTPGFNERWVKQRGGADKLKQMDAGELNAFFIHIEGRPDDTTSTSWHVEFGDVEKTGFLREELVIIHGTGLGYDQFKKMAEATGHDPDYKGVDLVWSPLSNRMLYGLTTDVVTARRAGVNVCLGSDWAPSGSKNLLGELKMADEIDNNEFGNKLSYRDLVDMVTANPAYAIHWDKTVGKIAPGYYADILVVDDRGDDYGSVVQATDKNVELVMVGGDPLYGDEAYMKFLKGTDLEQLADFGGRKKFIDTTVDHPDDPKSEERASEIIAKLKSAVRMDPDDMFEKFGKTLKPDLVEKAQRAVDRADSRIPKLQKQLAAGTLSPAKAEKVKEKIDREARSRMKAEQDLAELGSKTDREVFNDHISGRDGGKFRQGGVVPVQLSPIYATGDDEFFKRIEQAGVIAHWSPNFNYKGYWDHPDAPVPPEGGAAPVVTAAADRATIGGTLAGGYQAHLYDGDQQDTGEHLSRGSEVEVLERNGTRTRVRAKDANGNTVEGWVYSGFVDEPTAGSGASTVIQGLQHN